MLPMPVLELNTVDMASVEERHLAGNYFIGLAFIKRSHKPITGIESPVGRDIHTYRAHNLLGGVIFLSVHLNHIASSVFRRSGPSPLRRVDRVRLNNLIAAAVAHERVVRWGAGSRDAHGLARCVHSLVCCQFPTQVRGHVYNRRHLAAIAIIITVVRILLIIALAAGASGEKQSKQQIFVFHTFYCLMMVTRSWSWSSVMV